MRRRYQQGSVRAIGGSWVAQWRDEHRRKRKETFGHVSAITKSQARHRLADIVREVSIRRTQPSADWILADFMQRVYLPFYRRKWKLSSAMTNEDGIRYHILSELGIGRLGSFHRTSLQDFLDRKATAGLSFNYASHLRWDLSQIFGMAEAEGLIPKNPARLLFIPREARRSGERRRMNIEQVRLMHPVLDPRELAIAMLATTVGMRPGEILALKWRHIGQGYLEVRQRVYRGKIDSPKSVHSERRVALSAEVQATLDRWRQQCPNSGNPDAWVFPSERLSPLSRDNCFRRHIRPRLEKVGLGWVDFHAMRRTASSLMRELGVDPKTVADQLGHTVDVNLNVYTSVGLDKRREAVEALNSALRVN